MARSGMTLVGDWAKVLAHLGDLGGRITRELGQATVRLAADAPGDVREAMARATTPALHPFTVEQKGSNVPLVGGALERAVVARVEPGGLGVWVGVPAGSELSMIARVQEFGYTMQVTDRQRAYLHHQGLHLSPDTLYLVIPPRPFLRPGLAQVRARARRLYREALARALRG